jgi:ribosomal 50S subunit-recycling heat shock protein
MRLDRYLSVARIFKSRTLAAEAAASSMVFVNGLPAKPSSAIKPGAVIEINTPLFYKKIEVVEIPSGNLPKDRAGGLYRILEEREKT